MLAEEIRFCVFLNNAHHTGNTYIITPNVFSMEVLALINGINSIFRNLCYSNANRMEARLEIIFLASVLFKEVRCIIT